MDAMDLLLAGKASGQDFYVLEIKRQLLPSRFARDRLGVDALNFTYTYDVTVTDMFFKCVVCLHPDLCALVDTQTLRLGSGIKIRRAPLVIPESTTRVRACPYVEQLRLLDFALSESEVRESVLSCGWHPSSLSDGRPSVSNVTHYLPPGGHDDLMDSGGAPSWERVKQRLRQARLDFSCAAGDPLPPAAAAAAAAAGGSAGKFSHLVHHVLKPDAPTDPDGPRPPPVLFVGAKPGNLQEIVTTGTKDGERRSELAMEPLILIRAQMRAKPDDGSLFDVDADGVRTVPQAGAGALEALVPGGEPLDPRYGGEDEDGDGDNGGAGAAAGASSSSSASSASALAPLGVRSHMPAGANGPRGAVMSGVPYGISPRERDAIPMSHPSYPGLHRPLVGRLALVGRLEYWGSPDNKVPSPFKFDFKLMDGTRSVRCTAWNNSAGAWHAALAGVALGSGIAVVGYRVKVGKDGKLEVSVNQSGPRGTLFAVGERDLDRYASHLNASIVSAFPPPPLHWLTLHDVQRLPGAHMCSVAGIVARVGPVCVEAVGAPDYDQRMKFKAAPAQAGAVFAGAGASSSSSYGAAEALDASALVTARMQFARAPQGGNLGTGPGPGRRQKYRWVWVRDRYSQWDVPIKLYAGANEEAFEAMAVDRPLAVTHVKVVDLPAPPSAPSSAQPGVSVPAYPGHYSKERLEEIAQALAEGEQEPEPPGGVLRTLFLACTDFTSVTLGDEQVELAAQTRRLRHMVRYGATLLEDALNWRIDALASQQEGAQPQWFVATPSGRALALHHEFRGGSSLLRPYSLSAYGALLMGTRVPARPVTSQAALTPAPILDLAQLRALVRGGLAACRALWAQAGPPLQVPDVPVALLEDAPPPAAAAAPVPPMVAIGSEAGLLGVVTERDDENDFGPPLNVRSATALATTGRAFPLMEHQLLRVVVIARVARVGYVRPALQGAASQQQQGQGQGQGQQREQEQQEVPARRRRGRPSSSSSAASATSNATKTAAAAAAAVAASLAAAGGVKAPVAARTRGAASVVSERGPISARTRAASVAGSQRSGRSKGSRGAAALLAAGIAKKRAISAGRPPGKARGLFARYSDDEDEDVSDDEDEEGALFLPQRFKRTTAPSGTSGSAPTVMSRQPAAPQRAAAAAAAAAPAPAAEPPAAASALLSHLGQMVTRLFGGKQGAPSSSSAAPASASSGHGAATAAAAGKGGAREAAGRGRGRSQSKDKGQQGDADEERKEAAASRGGRGRKRARSASAELQQQQPQPRAGGAGGKKRGTSAPASSTPASSAAAAAAQPAPVDPISGSLSITDAVLRLGEALDDPDDDADGMPLLLKPEGSSLIADLGTPGHAAMFIELAVPAVGAGAAGASGVTMPLLLNPSHLLPHIPALPPSFAEPPPPPPPQPQQQQQQQQQAQGSASAAAAAAAAGDAGNGQRDEGDDEDGTAAPAAKRARAAPSAKGRGRSGSRPKGRGRGRGRATSAASRGDSDNDSNATAEIGEGVGGPDSEDEEEDAVVGEVLGDLAAGMDQQLDAEAYLESDYEATLLRRFFPAHVPAPRSQAVAHICDPSRRFAFCLLVHQRDRDLLIDPFTGLMRTQGDLEALTPLQRMALFGRRPPTVRIEAVYELDDAGNSM